MEIEAGNPPFPPSQFISNSLNRELVMMNQMVGGTFFHDTTLTPTPVPYPNSNALPPPTSFQAYAKEADDSGLTSNNNVILNNMGVLPSSRKRSTDCYPIPNDSSTVTYGYVSNNNYGGCDVVSQRIKFSSSLFEQEAALQIQLQQREVDCLIAQHTQRLRAELEERAKQQTKALGTAVRAAVDARLREKDEEIQRVAKQNWELQERIRSLGAENQLWRGVAQSNEAAVNSLRTDLERVLTGTTGAGEDNRRKDPEAAEGEEEEEESSCGSNEEEVGRGRKRGCKGGCGGWLEEEEEEESGVVVMPCRHVFLQCKRCNASSRHSCPVCGSPISATLRVHLPPCSY